MRARVLDAAALGPSKRSVIVSVLHVEYAEGPDELYHVPMAWVPRAPSEDALVAVHSGGDGDWIDALQDDDACRQLLSIACRGGRAHGAHGEFVSTPIGSTRLDVSPDAHVHRPAALHSNSVAVVDDRLVLKLLRRVEAGVNPELEIGRFLAQHGDVAVPPLRGSIEYVSLAGGGETAATLVVVQDFVHSRGTGWDYAVADLRGQLQEGLSAQVRYEEVCGTLGRRTADLHIALASAAPSAPAFVPDSASVIDVRAMVAMTATQANVALDLLADATAEIDAETAALRVRALRDRRALLARLVELGEGIGPFPRIRVHGDYHLGQVLVTDALDFVILDFEGEPTRPLDVRRAKHSPLRDIAGMIRSWSYAADVACRGAEEAASGHVRDGRSFSAEWERHARGAFLDAYLEAVAGHPLLPRDDARVKQALDFFMLDKVIYELQYELNNRPDWIRIPLEGLLGLLAAEESA